MKYFGDKQFELFSELIYNRYGIVYKEAKIDMLQTKLNKVMSRYQIEEYDDFFSMLQKGQDQNLEKEFLDDITIHKTDFFREMHHFDYITENIKAIMEMNPDIKSGRELRVWSSACSTGEEPYTIAMILKECLPKEIKLRVLGTDISKKVISSAQSGTFSNSIKEEIPPLYLSKYFIQSGNKYSLIEEIKSSVSFRLFNLMDNFPFKNNFHIIFCRNVMIYFDTKTQYKLIEKMYNVLNPGGLLLLGHSEGLVNKDIKVKFIQPSIYVKG